jgi:hypothetical protein
VPQLQLVDLQLGAQTPHQMVLPHKSSSYPDALQPTLHPPQFLVATTHLPALQDPVWQAPVWQGEPQSLSWPQFLPEQLGVQTHLPLALQTLGDVQAGQFMVPPQSPSANGPQSSAAQTLWVQLLDVPEQITFPLASMPFI